MSSKVLGILWGVGINTEGKFEGWGRNWIEGKLWLFSVGDKGGEGESDERDGEGERDNDGEVGSRSSKTANSDKTFKAFCVLSSQKRGALSEEEFLCVFPWVLFFLVNFFISHSMNGIDSW